MQDTLHKDFNRNNRGMDLPLNYVHASLVFHAEITPGAHRWNRWKACLFFSPEKQNPQTWGSNSCTALDEMSNLGL